MTDIREIVFTRGDQSFTFGLMPPYQLHPDTMLPSAQALDSSGIEYMGRNGGMGLAARVQRQTVEITFNVVARDPNVSYTQLLSDASMFFRPMNSDLSVTRFDMTVTMRDGTQWMMRRGHVSVPFSAPATRLLGFGVQGKLGLIFDDPNRYWVSGAGVVSGRITPSGDPGTLMGERWQGGMQIFAGGQSQWFLPSAGASGVPQSVTISSAYPIPVSFKIYGQITNPKLVNITNGDTWNWPGTLKSGEVLTVDEDGVMLDQHGIRRFNASGGLKAEPGVNTFALYGQNVSHSITTAWTGTADASTSTLSQDGAVVATNLFTSPKPTSNLTISNKTRVVSSTPGTGLLLAQTSSVSTGNGAFAQIPLSGLTSGVTYHVEADMIPSASVKPPSLNGRMMLMVANRSGMTLVSGDNTVSAGRRACTFTADGVTSYDLVLFAGDGGGDTSMSVLWSNILIMTDADWAAMQDLGIDWFDGGTMTPEIAPLVDSYANVMIRGAF